MTPDTKDWTWVVERACPDCGFDAAALAVADLPELLRATTLRWSTVLRGDDVRRRPAADVWSPLEYAAHVRDVHRIFAERVSSMLRDEAPTFANWDQDVAAIEGDYARQDPVDVEVALIEAAGECAGIYAGVRIGQLQRTGLRSNGSAFTVETIGRYHLHDVVHHLGDVGA
ncbi:DinB family protein [Nocardioides daejeonensis]|uniref:DinB family protein n=1 Tax=Nocardioides daejeonensis TaxID=1046556 RepID=UPI000D740CCE|nr:DinB family protein [Nocardioides daejeonensis]